MKVFTITLFVVFLAVAGQIQLYTSPGFGVFFVFLGILAWFVAIALWVQGRTPPLSLPAAILLIPVTISIFDNVDVANFTQSRLVLFLIALAVMVIGHVAGESRLRQSLHYAGMAWPVIWAADALTGWAHRADTLAFWPVLFILSFWRGRFWPFAIPHIIILFHRDSRGAIVAAIVGILVYEWLARGRPHPSTISGWFLLGLTGVSAAFVAGWGLVMWRYRTAMDRLAYWYHSWLAFLDSPIYGVGPGGLDARHLVFGINGPHQIHAHNALVSWLAETGLIGLACLALVIGYVYCTRRLYQVKHWQLSLLAGLLIWSMVDEPLFWPGPLVIVAAIIGTITKKPL